MALRIHELHPSLAHYPLVLLPAAIMADIAGAVAHSDFFTRMGRLLMPIAAASGAATGVAGLVAQDAVQPEGHARDLLITHRNLDIGLVVATAVLAAMRLRSFRPSPGYLAAGVATAIAAHYTAYLGGTMVYRHGVGVEAAGGVEQDRSPELGRRSIRKALRVAGDNVVHSLRHAAKHAAEGEIVPALGHRSAGETPQRE